MSEIKEKIDENSEKHDSEESTMTNNKYMVDNNCLYRLAGGQKEIVSNFYMTIGSQKVKTDGNKVEDRLLDLDINLAEQRFHTTVSAEEFFSKNLKRRVLEVAGPGAIIYGSIKDLVIAAQEMSKKDIATTAVSTSNGFRGEDLFISKNLKITKNGISPNTDLELDLSGGNYAPRLGFIYPDPEIMRPLGYHILTDFLRIKSPAVMLPLMAHISLASFASLIRNEFGKGKPVLHLQGPSGEGKTFLGLLGMSFFGHFEDRVMSWTSTANAIETEGWHFRDSLYLVDDFKAGYVDTQGVIRVLQGHADGHGRNRLRSNLRIAEPKQIRGLLLSTGEDFISIESVLGRTILISVGPEKDIRIGERCWQNRSCYPMFLPGLIQMVISRANWKDGLRQSVEKKIEILSRNALGLSNGLRIASNWALNWLGFELFLDYLQNLKVIDSARKSEMTSEYREIAGDMLVRQSAELRSENPVAIMFRVLGQKMSTGGVSIPGLSHTPEKGKKIGQLKNPESLIILYPDILLEALLGHFRAVGQKMPFTKNSLRDALAQEGLIEKSNGRWTRQVRGTEGRRFQGWAMDAKQFLNRCGLEN